MAGRSIGSALRGEKKGFNALLRPGQSRTSPAHREDDGDPIEEMGEIERTARTLKLPQNPVDVRSKPEPATVEALRGGRNGERKKVGVGRITPTGQCMGYHFLKLFHYSEEMLSFFLKLGRSHIVMGVHGALCTMQCIMYYGPRFGKEICSDAI